MTAAFSGASDPVFMGDLNNGEKDWHVHGICGLTFELRGSQRWDARPGLVKMYRVPPDRAWWPAVGAPFERGVRPHSRRSADGPNIFEKAMAALV